MQDVIKALRAGASDFLTKPILDFALLDLPGQGLGTPGLLRERRRHAQELETKVNERIGRTVPGQRQAARKRSSSSPDPDKFPEVFWLHRLDPPHILFVSAASTRIFGRRTRTCS
jgi:hypothetical protein